MLDVVDGDVVDKVDGARRPQYSGSTQCLHCLTKKAPLPVE